MLESRQRCEKQSTVVENPGIRRTRRIRSVGRVHHRIFCDLVHFYFDKIVFISFDTPQRRRIKAGCPRWELVSIKLTEQDECSPKVPVVSRPRSSYFGQTAKKGKLATEWYIRRTRQYQASTRTRQVLGSTGPLYVLDKTVQILSLGMVEPAWLSEAKWLIHLRTSHHKAQYGIHRETMLRTALRYRTEHSPQP
jgi:hypothetical protein